MRTTTSPWSVIPGHTLAFRTSYTAPTSVHGRVIVALKGEKLLLLGAEEFIPSDSCTTMIQGYNVALNSFFNKYTAFPVRCRTCQIAAE